MSPKIQLTRNDEYSVHSQFGEDGILARILGTLGVQCGTAVEFGASDGILFSNTANLRAQGWKTVLIEGNEYEFSKLKALRNERTITVNAMVEPAGVSSLDGILDDLRIDAIDVLSIDIDGGDLDILRHLKRRPRIICIEFNPTIPPPCRFANPPGELKGSSLAEIKAAAEERGYHLVYATYCNAFLIHGDDSAPFELRDAHSAFHMWERGAIACFCDGEFTVVGNRNARTLRNPWSTVPVFIPRLPKALLSWPPTRTKVLLSYLFCALAAPAFYVRELAVESSRVLARQPRGWS